MLTLSFPPYRFAEFFQGCCAGYLFITRKDEATHNGLLALACLCFAVLVYVNVRDAGVPPVPTQGPIFTGAVYALACGGTFLSRLLESRLVVRLGDASYSLYLLHWPALLLLMHHYGRGKAPLLAAVAVALALGCIAASLVCYYVVETPARRRIRGLLPARAPAWEAAMHVKAGNR